VLLRIISKHYRHTISKFNPGWSISLFHYRNHGSDFGRVLVGLLVGKDDDAAFEDFLSKIDYTHFRESENPVYEQFLQ
jgi:threonine dehydratase